MRTRVVLFVVLVALTTLCVGQGEKTAKKSGQVEQQIKALEQQNKKAALSGDVSFSESHLAANYFRIGPDGSVATRDQALQTEKGGQVKYTAIDSSEEQIYVYGNTVVTEAKYSVKGTDGNGQSFDGDYRCTRVWVKEGGQWKIAAFQITKIASPK